MRPRAEAMIPAASLFHSFGDPNRLSILHHLQLGEHRVVDLVRLLDLPQSTASRHLICLRDTDMVTMRPEGRASVYSQVHPGEMVELLSAAEKILTLTGDAATPCPLHGSAMFSSKQSAFASIN